MTSEHREGSIEDLTEHYQAGIKVARILIDEPEFYFRERTPEQEELSEKKFHFLYEHQAKRLGIQIPPCITTWWGKGLYVYHELFLKDEARKWGVTFESLGSGEATSVGHVQVASERQVAHNRMMMLTGKEIEELKAKAQVKYSGR